MVTTSNLESDRRPLSSRAAAAASIDPGNFTPERVLRIIKAPPILNELVVPQEYLDLAQGALESLDCSVTSGALEQSDGGETITFRFTLVQRRASRRALLYIRDEILTDFNRNNRVAVQEVRDIFQSEFRTLYVFHDSHPAPTYRNLMTGEWPQKYKVATKFLPLSDVAGFGDMSEAQQAEYLSRELDLDREDEEPAAGGRPSAANLPPQQLAQKVILPLQRILVEHNAWGDDARQRKVLVQMAGLLDFPRTFDFAGDPTTVAGDLVFGLKYPNLAQLLEFLRDHNETPPDDKRTIEDILGNYSFD